MKVKALALSGVVALISACSGGTKHELNILEGEAMGKCLDAHLGTMSMDYTVADFTTNANGEVKSYNVYTKVEEWAGSGYGYLIPGSFLNPRPHHGSYTHNLGGVLAYAEDVEVLRNPKMIKRALEACNNVKP